MLPRLPETTTAGDCFDCVDPERPAEGDCSRHPIAGVAGYLQADSWRAKHFTAGNC